MSSLALACRLGAGSTPTLPRRVRSILRKYPSMLHIAGPAVPILGPELVSNGAFDTADGWSAATGWGIAAGALNHTAASTLMPALAVATQAGKTYQCAYSITSQSAAGSGVSLRLGSTNLTIRNAVGTYSETLAQTVDSTIIGFIARGGSGDWLGSIDNLSVREIVGYQNTYSSFAAGNYKESTGQNLVAVDQQVGLVLDAAASAITAASNLNGFSSVGGSPNVSLAPLAFTTTTSFLGVTIPCVVGKWYRVTAIGSTTSDAFSINTYDASPARTEIKSGFGTCVFKADRPFIYLRHNNAGTTTLTALAIEELPGIHAQQATSGHQPYLRQVPKTLGPEMWANDYSGFTLGTGWSVSGNKLVGTSVAVTQSAFKNVGLALGKSYVARYRISSLSSGTVRAIASSGVSGAVRSAVGDYEDVITPSASSGNYGFIPFAAFTGEIEVLSIREVVEWTYAWQFDGGDDRFVASAVPFQPADDYFSVFGVVRNSDAVLRRVWEVQNVGIGGGMGVWLTNNTATFYASGATAVTVGVADGPVVITAKKLGNARSIQADNFAATTNTVPVTDHTSLTCVIGNTIAGDRPYSGPIYAGFLGKGAISDAEVQTLKRFVARLQGRNL